MCQHLPVFVYGTLRTRESRSSMWPRHPLTIEVIYTRGLLYDLGNYPGMTPGDLLVAGELWILRSEDLRITLEQLDDIEGVK